MDHEQTIDSTLITKDELKGKLIEFFQIAKASGDLSAGIRRYLEFVKDNYHSLDAEAKLVGDKAFDAIGEATAEALNKMPDSVEKRRLARLHAKSQGRHWDIKELSKSLEAGTHLKEKILQETDDFFFEHVQLIADFIHDVISGSVHGPDLALLSLYCSALDELIVSRHLTQHGYTPQALAHQRTVHEILDQIELFSKKPEYLDLWASETSEDRKKARWGLRPKGVREKLGREGYDPIFSFLSEMGSHSTMKYIQSKVFMQRPHKDGDVKGEAKIFVGGSPRTDTLMVASTGLVQSVMGTLTSFSVTYQDFLLAEEGIQVLQSAFEKYKGYMLRNFVDWMRAEGANVSSLETYIKSLDQETLMRMSEEKSSGSI